MEYCSYKTLFLLALASRAGKSVLSALCRGRDFYSFSVDSAQVQLHFCPNFPTLLARNS